MVRFEQLLDEDASLEEVLPSVYQRYQEHYQGYTLRRLCQEMHQLSVQYNIKQLQKEMFRKQHFPIVKMNPQQAHLEFIRGNVELLPLCELEGRIAAEGRCLILRAYCVWCPVKFGKGLSCVTSKLWRRGSTCFRDLRLSYKGYISRKQKMDKNVSMRMF